MKIVASNSARDAYMRVLAEMKKARANGGRIVVIAPDRFTASVERGLLLSLKEEGSFDIEVMSFTRMADRYVGDSIKKCLTPEGSVMLIAQVIDRCLRDKKLVYYDRSASKEGFASELYAALTAIRNSGISTAGLSAAANEATTVATRRKLSDIVTIYTQYLAALEGRHSDSTTRLEHLAKYIGENPSKFAVTHYFCTDINEFSAPEYEILRQLSLWAGSLTVGIECSYDSPNARIYPHRVIQRLKSLDRDRTVVVVAEDENMSAAVKAVSDRLFSYQPPEKPAENRGFLKIRRANDRGDEALRLALDILSHIRNGGKFSDFEVYVSDISDYENELKSVFARYDIPFFIDKRALLTEQTKVRYLLDAIACVRSGFGTRETLDFVKNPMFEEMPEVGEENAFIFENFVLERGIDKYLFAQYFAQKNQKEQFNCQKSDDKPLDELQIAANAVGRKLFEVLDPLLTVSSDDKDKKPRTGDFVNAVRALLTEVEPFAVKHTEKLGALSEYYVKCAEQVDNKLSAVLDEIEDVTDGETDIAGFEGVLKGMLKTLKISLVPTYLDCVFVGDSDSRFMGEGKIYALGATNDKFPKSASGGAVIGVNDEATLKSLGIPIVPDSMEKTYAEMFKILDLIKKAKSGVTISYPESGGASELRRSAVIDELRGILVEDGKPIGIERVDFTRPEALRRSDATSLLSTERGAGYLTVSSFGRAGVDSVLGTAYCCMSEDQRSRVNPRSVAPERVTMPPSKKLSKVSVSRLETFFNCPYKYFFKYTLGLKKRKDGNLQGTENGTVLHAVLEYFFRDLQKGDIVDASDIEARIDGYFDRAIKENGFENLLASPVAGRLLSRVKDESLRVCEKLYEISLRSEFKPRFLEQSVNDARVGLRGVTLETEDGKISLDGYIDRVDVADGQFVIVDYKSFKSADIEFGDVYFGNKLQLYIYMDAIRQNLALRPVGVFYLPIYIKFNSDKGSRFVYKGHATLDEDVLKRIDSAFPGTDAIIQNPNKGGLKRSKFLTEEEFDLLGDYALKLAAKGAQEISRGFIKPSPLADSCSRCDFCDICSFRDEANARKMTAVSISSFACDGAGPAALEGGEKDE